MRTKKRKEEALETVIQSHREIKGSKTHNPLSTEAANEKSPLYYVRVLRRRSFCSSLHNGVTNGAT